MIVGIFVGGKATRMHGLPKGLLRAPESGEPLVVRSCRLSLELGLTPVLVGSGEAYRAALPDLPQLADDPQAEGPLAGLRSLLAYAGARDALALACDMPHVSAALLARLTQSRSGAEVLAARGIGGYWEPLCARYRSAEVLPRLDAALAAGVRSFQALFRCLTVEELSLSDAERAQLVDWDCPEDVAQSAPKKR